MKWPGGYLRANGVGFGRKGFNVPDGCRAFSVGMIFACGSKRKVLARVTFLLNNFPKRMSFV